VSKLSSSGLVLAAFASVAALALSGCATSESRRTWVDPASIGDQAKYDLDHEQCRKEAMVTYHREAEARNAEMPGAVVAGAVGGALLGAAIMPVGVGIGAGTVVGSSAAESATANVSERRPIDSMMMSMRECLQEHGYTPIR